jgi:hypothetical protein
MPESGWRLMSPEPPETRVNFELEKIVPEETSRKKGAVLVESEPKTISSAVAVR